MNITDYQNELHKTLIEGFFTNNETITGQHIMTCTPEKQVNMFVLFLLMKAWKNQMETSKSPYFNYKNEEVEAAVKQYMNILSRHIEIKKDHFSPLLQTALSYTFELAKNPESFIVTNHLEGDLEEITKYIQYHKAYFKGDTTYDIQDLTPQVIEKLSSIVSFSAKEDVKIEEQEKPAEELVETTSTEKKQPPIADGSAPQPISINDRFSAEKPPQPEVRILKIESIKAAITLNQRFIFIKELCDQNEAQYNELVLRLDNCNDGAEALQVLEESVTLDVDGEALEKMKLLIQQKYNFTAK